MLFHLIGRSTSYVEAFSYFTRRCIFNGGKCRGPLTRDLFMRDSARKERESWNLSREEERAWLYMNNTQSHAHTRADNTLYNYSPSLSFFLSPTLVIVVLTSLSVSPASSPPRLAPCSRSVFLRCLKPRAGRSCYNPELADGRPMYGSLFYAACIALWCTTRERAQARARCTLRSKLARDIQAHWTLGCF